MRAHPLPGINKKIDAHKKEVAAEGLAGSSAFQYKSPFKTEPVPATKPRKPGTFHPSDISGSGKVETPGGDTGASAMRYNGDPSKGVLPKKITRTIEHLKKGGAFDTMDDTAPTGPPVHGGGGSSHFLERVKQGPITLKARFSDEFGNIKGTPGYEALDVEKEAPTKFIRRAAAGVAKAIARFRR